MPKIQMRLESLLLYISLFAVFIIFYHDVLLHIFKSWITQEGSHGPLILGVSIYLIWIKRKEIKDIEFAPAIIPGGFLLAAGCFAFFAGKLASTILVQQISIVPFLLGTILLFAGFSLFKLFLLPVGYLIFLTGFIEQLLGSIAIYLQQVTAWIAAFLLKLAGFPVFLKATAIELPHISLEVVRSCSGISHIVALLALAVPLAHFTQATSVRKIMIVVCALFIGIFSNGLRVALIGIYALFNEGADLHGPYETLYVSFIFFFGLVVLVFLSKLLNRKRAKLYQDEKSRHDSRGFFQQMSGGENSFSRKRLAPFIAAAIIFASTFWLLHFHTPLSVGLKQPLDQFPAAIAGFSGENMEQISDRLRPFPAHAELLRRYENHEGKSVELYIGYFERQDGGGRIIDYRRAWMHDESKIITVQANKERFKINKIRLRGQSEQLDVYFWYWLDGRMITDQYTGKFMTFFNGLLKRRTNAAVVVISTRDQEGEIMDLIAEVIKATGSHLSGTGSDGTYGSKTMS